MNRLKELREEKGLSMLTLSKYLDIPYTTYVNYEKGTREPNSEMLITLANYFKVSIDYLICRTDTPTTLYNLSVNPVNKNSLRSDEEELLSNYNKLNENGKEKVQEYTEDLTGNENYISSEEPKNKLNA